MCITLRVDRYPASTCQMVHMSLWIKKNISFNDEVRNVATGKQWLHCTSNSTQAKVYSSKNMIPSKEIRVFKYLLQYWNLFSLTVLPCLFVSISHFLSLIAVMDFFSRKPCKGICSSICQLPEFQTLSRHNFGRFSHPFWKSYNVICCHFIGLHITILILYHRLKFYSNRNSLSREIIMMAVREDETYLWIISVASRLYFRCKVCSNF